MKAPKCRLCGECHWSHEPHRFAINTAINKRSAINRPAINRAINTDDSAKRNDRPSQRTEALPVTQAAVQADHPQAVPSDSGLCTAQATTDGGRADRSPNRRARADYNAYMRDYMRRVRLLAKVAR